MPRLFQGDNLALPSGHRFAGGAFGEGRAGDGGRDWCPYGGAGGISWHISAHPRFSRHHLPAFPSISQYFSLCPSISWHLAASPGVPGAAFPAAQQWDDPKAPPFILEPVCVDGAGRWLLFGWPKPPLPLAALRGVGADPSPVPCACGTARAMPAGPGQPIPKPPPQRNHPPARLLFHRLGDEPPARDSRQPNAKFSMQIIS